LTVAFALWKALLFLVIVACPGPGYDTSTTLLTNEHSGLAPDSPTTALPLSFKFARWDAIYFVHSAEHGYVFEQEWAFSYPRVLGFFLSGKLSSLVYLQPSVVRFVDLLSPGIRLSGGLSGPVTAALIGVALSHVAHYLSVLALYGLSANVFGHETPTQRLICFLSAALHIISPAGAFLSAPYGESIFSFLNIWGFYIYTSSLIADHKGAVRFRDILVLAAAVLFALATLVRSNGILSGFLFAYDATTLAWSTLTKGPSSRTLRRLAVIVLGGSIVALGMGVPQILAYREFCLLGANSRPWCSWTVPSIYTWVQGQYWYVISPTSGG
jgi:phosphatidylinositol glycan class V